MKKIKYLLSILLLMNLPAIINAQAAGKESSVGEFMRSSQRSYVVIAVMITILTGIILYLARLDKKISKLEKEK